MAASVLLRQWSKALWDMSSFDGVVNLNILQLHGVYCWQYPYDGCRMSISLETYTQKDEDHAALRPGLNFRRVWKLSISSTSVAQFVLAYCSTDHGKISDKCFDIYMLTPAWRRNRPFVHLHGTKLINTIFWQQVGYGLGPAMGWVGLGWVGPEFFNFWWVGLGGDLTAWYY